MLVNLAKDLAAKGEIMMSEATAPTTSWCSDMAAPVKFLFDTPFDEAEAR
jgi:hypothetical protein